MARILLAAVAPHRMRFIAYCIVTHPFHVGAWPRNEGDPSRSRRWRAMGHTQRLHAQHHCIGSGYLGRFKSFLGQSDEDLLTICCSDERNALRVGLVW